MLCDNFCAANNTIEKLQGQLTEWNIFANNISDMGIYENI